MGRLSGGGLASRFLRTACSSSSKNGCGGIQPSEASCRRLVRRAATKSGDGDNKGSAKWREWVEGKLAETPASPSPSRSATAASSSSASNPVDYFERHVLGKTGGEDEEDDADFHEFRESLEPAEPASTDATPEEDDFLEELTKIEKEGASFPSTFGRKKDQGDIMLTRGYDDDKVPFDDEVDPENDESLLDAEDAVFWSEELQKFVTPKGLLNLPGMAAKDDVNKPYQLRPDKTYFPGQIVEPEDFDITRTPSTDVMDGSIRSKKVNRKNEVLAAADFRNIKFLSMFLSETSRVLPRRTTGVTWKCQRKLAREIKTARWLGLIPFTSMGDPPFRYLKNKPAKDIDPEDEYHEELEDEEPGRARRRVF